MSPLKRIGLRVALAGLVAFGSYWNVAQAQLTPAGVNIQNRATVNYSVGGVGQTEIESSPTGNSTPGTGLGADTTFVVDQVVDLTVSEASTNATVTSPGATAAVISFTVQNDGNAPQGYQLTISEEVATSLFGNVDSFDIGLANLQVRVDEDPSAGDGTGNGLYDGTETATAIDTLNPGQQITVFVVATIPLAAVNGDFANVRLLAQTAVAGTNGATLETSSGGPNDPNVVEVVFGDDLDAVPFDGADYDTDQYAIQSAALTVTKDATVISDPFSSPTPFSVPGAFVEYTITIANTGTTAADAIVVGDDVPPNTTLELGQFAGSDIEVTVGGGPATGCTADNLDGDGDGCGFDGTTVTVGAPALGSIPAASNATVSFQVSID